METPIIQYDANALKRKFYTACNCMMTNCYNVSEVVQLQMQESYCVPPPYGKGIKR